MFPQTTLWSQFGPAWLYTAVQPHSEDEKVIADRFLELCAGSFGPGRATTPVTPTARMSTQIQAGSDLLVNLLPATGPSVLSHVGLIALADEAHDDGPLQSLAGGDPLPSTIIVSPTRLQSPWLMAESLLHEGLHLKMFDALRCGSYTAEADLALAIPWRNAPWTLIRVIAAFHVYVHLLLLQQAAVERASSDGGQLGASLLANAIDEPSQGTAAHRDHTYRTTSERAAYLAEQLLEVHRNRLTPLGSDLVDWLNNAMNRLGVYSKSVDSSETENIGREAPSSPTLVAAPSFDRLPNRLRKAVPFDAVELANLGQLVVARGEGTRFQWLNETAWLVYSLIDGRPTEAVLQSFNSYVKQPEESSAYAVDVDSCLSELLRVGLIEEAT